MGQDKREIPRQGSANLMQTPEKGMSQNDLMGSSGPSPTGEKLSQILSGGGMGNLSNDNRNREFGSQKGSIGSGLGNYPSGFEGQGRAVSAGARSNN